MQSVLKFWHTGSKGGDYLIGAVIVVPLYLLMFRMFPERKMKEQEALLTKKEYQLGLLCFVANNINDCPFRYYLNKNIGCL